MVCLNFVTPRFRIQCENFSLSHSAAFAAAAADENGTVSSLLVWPNAFVVAVHFGFFVESVATDSARDPHRHLVE